MDDAASVPVIVEAHGFPGEACRRFDRKVQYFVSQGYAVLKPNFRGTQDREEGFAASIRGDWGGAEQADLAAAAAWLAEQNWASPDHIALYGHSFGGFSTYTQLVRYPETWTVGVASGGFTDLHLLDAAKGGDELLREHMGHPRDDAARWRDRSPITHVEDIERPLFVLHGQADPTTPISQARAFKGALESDRGWTAGDDFEYREIVSGEHGNLDAKTNARRWRLIIDFIDRQFGHHPSDS
jgi:dipeptidyl aminopeptidase/acylaminoacyl peptidase